MVANSTFLWPYNWPLDWPFWCNLLTEGVVSHEELGNAKKALSKKCASSVHPKNATERLGHGQCWYLLCLDQTLEANLTSLRGKKSSPDLDLNKATIDLTSG